MTEELLRRWVRGELPDGERRVVSRWIVRCTSPELGPLLYGMSQERKQERADTANAGRPGLWTTLVARWNALLDVGRAHLSAGFDGPLVLASTGPAGAPDPLTLVDVDGARHALLRVPEVDDTEIALFLTDDTGAATCLVTPIAATTAVSIPLPMERGQRATVWAIRGRALSRDADAANALEDALGRSDVEAWAVREQAD